MTRERAEQLRKTLNSAMQLVDNDTALSNKNMYDTWQEGINYITGTKILYNDILYKVLQNHLSQLNWTPDVAPSLFAQILGGQNGTQPTEWVQPDSTNPYMKGDKVLYDGIVYECVIDNCVWSPVDYPTAWKIL